ncbi:MAG: ATP-dependent Clp protease ATP-binding subunit ClpX, partial [Ignavibacteriaceae bacterium]|nr:ATP-dependent Clp protease ATP-binding subunit ClpX [Ignavibacteriaceae bacterium]
KLFSMEGVKLEFDPFALDAVVKKAMARKTGARALRSIIEDFMIDVMYDLPSKTNVDKCIITRDVVEERADPIYIESDRKSA